jgi:hypothetical protein
VPIVAVVITIAPPTYVVLATYKLPPTPTPPATTNAPVSVEVAVLVPVTDKRGIVMVSTALLDIPTPSMLTVELVTYSDLNLFVGDPRSTAPDVCGKTLPATVVVLPTARLPVMLSTLVPVT